jgi:AI-2 transport protein TqsA
MLKKLKDDQGLKILVMLASVVVIVFGLRAAESFFAPVLLAFFIATISFPITNWLRQHRVPRILAVLTTVLVDFAFLTGIILIAFSLVGDLQLGWEVKYQRLSMEKIVDSEQWAVGILTDWKVEDPAEKVREYVTGDLLAQLSSMSDILDVSKNVIGGVASFFATSFIVLILTVFMLTEARMYGRRLNAICEARGPDLQRLFSASKDIQRFLGIKTAVSLTTGLLAGFLCWAAGLDFFLLWGILAFALNYIPVVGSVIAGIPPMLLALLLYGWPSSLAVAIGYIAINIFLGNFVEPMLLGRRFGFSTLVVIMSVLFWGWVWGPVGMLMAVPLTVLLKVILDNSYEFRWLSVALGKEDRKAHNEEALIKEAVESSESLHLPEGTATEGGSSSP